MSSLGIKDIVLFCQQSRKFTITSQENLVVSIIPNASIALNLINLLS